MSLRNINLKSLSRLSKGFNSKSCIGVIVPVSTNLNVQCIPSSYFSTSSILFSSNQRPDWNRAVSEAEKIVGYSTSFLSLRCLLTDEIPNVTMHLKELVGSNHPLQKTAMSLPYNDQSNMQLWGLIVMLFSKAAGHRNVADIEEDKAAGVLHRQRELAEVTDMLHTSHLAHKCLVNIYPGEFTEPGQLRDMTIGNKIALLIGDYLLSASSVKLAAIRNHGVVELMSTALRDQAVSKFIGARDKQNNPLPSAGGDTAHSDWTQRNVLSPGSLLARSCQGTLKLAEHSSQLQEEGYKFGIHFALAWQACLELEPFIGSHYLPGSMFSLTSAPLMFHLERDPSLYSEIEKGSDTVHAVDFSKVHQIVSKGPGIELTKQLLREHSQKALEVLSVFQEIDARKALTNIIFTMGDL